MLRPAARTVAALDAGKTAVRLLKAVPLPANSAPSIVRAVLTVLLAILAGVPPALGGANRDIVFECPCDAEWTQVDSDGGGQLTLNFGVRSFRAVNSGEVRLSLAANLRNSDDVVEGVTWGVYRPSTWPPVGSIPPETVVANQSRTFNLRRPDGDQPVLIQLRERAAQLPPDAEENAPFQPWRRHEGLTLWPVSNDESSGHIRFVDILTDTDGDGVGDINELLAGTSPEDAADTPGPSTVDVLVLFEQGVFDAYEGDPYTRLHHLMTVARAIYADSGTNIRLRVVGMSPIGETERGISVNARALMESHGADLMLQVHLSRHSEYPCASSAAGCASVGDVNRRGLWTPAWAATLNLVSAWTPAHELGHVMGLVHSARQGEFFGAFRWSRGHFIVGDSGRHRPQGTVMSYGDRQKFGDRFSSSLRHCHGQPCGVPVDEFAGADATASLDLLRFQVAASRDSIPDSDGDGFVDAVDAAPDDPNEWSDIDGDGIGEFADTDDDNDGVEDGEDAFPFDPEEWADVDGDGIGDNADTEVADLAPFRDPALRAVVEEALGIESGAPIADADLASLDSLNAWNKGIHDLAGLERATNLSWVNLQVNAISDLSPLSGLPRLGSLFLDRNIVSDLSPLAASTGLEVLKLQDNDLSDIAPLAELRSLQDLRLSGNAIKDLSPLTRLGGLTALNLERNALTELSPLSDLTRLVDLRLTGNPVSDLSPLSNLRLETLTVGHNDVTLQDVAELGRFRRIASLHLTSMGIDDISALADLINPRELNLRDNLISDVSPLAELTGIERLDLSDNEIADIGPLVNRAIWRGSEAAEAVQLNLQGNPLDRRSIEEHVPRLESWGLNVQTRRFPDGEPPVEIPDAKLHARIVESVSGASIHVDMPITEGSIAKLTTLHASGSGLTDLTGLEAAQMAQYLYLGSNAVRDLTPLENLPGLTGIDLSDNRIADIAPLVDNPGLAEGDWVSLNGNPLSEESVNVHIPALLQRGVDVSFDGVPLATIAAGGPARFDTAGYFEAVLGDDLQVTARVSNPGLAHAEVESGLVTAMPGASGGRVTVTVTASNADAQSAEVTFALTIEGAVAVATFPPAHDPVRQGFMRVINHTANSESLRIEAFNEGGTRRGPVTLRVGSGQAAQFNSEDLESGNAAKGLSGSIGRSRGDWRLAFEGVPEAEVLSYIRTGDGFLTAMHDLAPLRASGHEIAVFNPGDNPNQVSLLRLANPGNEAAELTITGIDDAGASPGGPVTLTLDARTARTLSALELETGDGLSGALGDGAGKWRLNVASDRPILAAGLMRSPTGHLTNLSTVPHNKTVRGAETVHRVPLFLSASDPEQRQGFVRVINRSPEEAAVSILAHDNSSAERDPIVLTVAADSAVHFNSDDLELGNARKGLSAGVGAGVGDWRLELASEASLDVLAYIRTRDGFLTSMHDTVRLTSEGYVLPVFNPGDNPNQVSRLYIANDSPDWATVRVWGIDDRGAPGGNVLLWVPPGQSRTYTAQDLENGGGVRRGKLGGGTGKWRLRVTSDIPVDVMSLLQSPSGHLTNLSTGPH